MRGPAILSMRWHNLLFLHWPMPVLDLRPFVPAALPLDTWDGSAWLSVVALRSSHVRPMRLPLPGDWIAFAQVNVRTYTTVGGKRGIWLLSVDCADRLTVVSARGAFGAPYFHADVRSTPENGGVRFTSRRSGDPGAVFAARYRPVGPVREAEAGSLDHFLLDRLSLYASHRLARVLRADIHHDAWPLQPVEAEVEANTLLDRLGLAVPGAPAVMHFSPGLDVVGGPPVRVVRARGDRR